MGNLDFPSSISITMSHNSSRSSKRLSRLVGWLSKSRLNKKCQNNHMFPPRPAGVQEGRQCLQLSRRRLFDRCSIFCTCDTPLITSGGSDYKLIYRHYATLYFVFCVDSSESELGILDLIQVSFGTFESIFEFPSSQVFVETLDKCFENVCELDLIFHMDKVLT